MNENSDALLVTAPEAAKKLAISPRTLWGLTKSGEIACVRVGRRAIRYDVADLRRWIQTRKTEGAKSSFVSDGS
jgi:excisionase family DNA binding protein